MKKLGFIGGGNMAEALIRGLIAGKVCKPAELIASDVDPKRRQTLKRKLKVDTTADNREVVRKSRAVLLAVKPQQIDEVLSDLASVFLPSDHAESKPRRSAATKLARPPKLKDRLFISIAAGITLDRLLGALGAQARAIRVMPNAPAMVGQGMAALVRAPGASKADLSFGMRLFQAVGDAVALDREDLLDAVTALSGSGPAYVYLFVKALAEAGIAEGLPADLAIRMALQTVRGAEENMRRSPLDAADLIRIVASPGGTTEAALKSFDASGFPAIVGQALHAAAHRSRELGRT